MSFTGQAIVNLALYLSNVDSANVSAANQLALLNHCLRAYYRDGNAIDASFSLSTASTPVLTAGTQEYALFSASNVGFPEELNFVGYRSSSTSGWQRLYQISEADARSYDQLSGQPFAYYESNVGGVYTVGLVPKPDSAVAASGTTIIFDYRYKPTDLTALSDTIYLPDEAQNALVPALVKLLIAGDGYANVAAMQMADQMAAVEEAKNADSDLAKALSEVNINPLVFGDSHPSQPDGSGGNPWTLS